MLKRLTNFRTKFITITQKFDGVQLPERFKGTIVEKWSNYWKQLYIDYKDVFVDIGKHVRTRPLSSSAYASIAGAAYLCFKNNPDELGFIEQLRKYNNEIILVHSSSHNPESTEHLKFIEKCYNQGIIRRFTVGVASFIWLDNYDQGVALYKAMCPHLKPRLSEFRARAIDFGFWNKWWILDNKMIDYDVNF